MGQVKYQRLKELMKEKIAQGLWKPGQKIPSERAISQQAGVSRITVKTAIHDLIQEGRLEYRAGRRGTFARDSSQAPAVSKLIGVAIDDITDAFGADMLRGIEDFLWDKRFHVVLCNADRDFHKVEEYFRSLLQLKIAGVIFSPVIDHGYFENNRRILSLLERRGIPYVLIDRYLPNLSSSFVVSNHRESSRQVTRHLLSQGHRDILVAAGIPCTSMDDRLLGYCDALEEAGLQPQDRLILRLNDNLLYKNPDPREMERMGQLVEEAGPFTAFYALNGRLLRAGISLLLSLGKRIGEEVRLAVNDEISKPFPPHTDDIPRAVQPVYEMGWEAARILLESILEPGKSIVRMILTSRFIAGRA